MSIGFLDAAFDDIVLWIYLWEDSDFTMQVLRCRTVVGDVNLVSISYLYLRSVTKIGPYQRESDARVVGLFGFRDPTCKVSIICNNISASRLRCCVTAKSKVSKI